MTLVTRYASGVVQRHGVSLVPVAYGDQPPSPAAADALASSTSSLSSSTDALAPSPDAVPSGTDALAGGQPRLSLANGLYVRPECRSDSDP